MLHRKRLEKGSNIPAWKGGLTGLQINENFGHKFFYNFLFTSLNICFWCSKDFDYPQHMFWLKNKKIYL